jgi:hypothetical protein
MEQIYGSITADCLPNYTLVHLSFGARISQRLTLGVAEPGRNISLRLLLSL